jgi:trehalose 6-phosphate phosphatase
MDNNKRSETKNRIKALIFDLDGVVTQTQKVHKKAWKEMFDEFFKTCQESKTDTKSMSDEDYKVYLDGKPRYEGVKSFLQARGIELPYGKPSDPPDEKTVCGLGNKKNKLFNEHIDKGEVHVYEDAVASIRAWRQEGFNTAIVTSSKNCEKILNSTNLTGLFDVMIDGVVSAERKLKGKPDPDIFLEASKDLGISPDQSVVFEDAISGVEAGQRGHFRLVVGVDRFNNKTALLENGADLTIETFQDFKLLDNPDIKDFLDPPKPPVFSEKSELFELLNQKKPVFFLDYDGTLTPIVSRPEDALLSAKMKEILQELAEIFKVAIVTGRDMPDIRKLVGLDNLIYAGSHGYSIIGPDNLAKEHEKAEEIVPVLDKMENELENEFEGITEGVQIDRKRYALGVHYRNARESDIPIVYEVVEKMLNKYKGYKKGEGKKIVEIKPAFDWHKGKAVNWILETLGLSDREKYLPVYIGDDITDEDAFKELKNNGLGILVGNHDQPSAADYSLKNVFQVRELFDEVITMYKSHKGVV